MSSSVGGVLSIVRFFSTTVSLPLKSAASRAVTRSTAGPSLTPGTFASATVIDFSRAGVANCSVARLCYGPALGQSHRDGSQARAAIGHVDLERCDAEHLGIGQDRDPRRLGFETWPQVIGATADGGDDDDEEGNDDRQLAATSIGREGVHSGFCES